MRRRVSAGCDRLTRLEDGWFHTIFQVSADFLVSKDRRDGVWS